MEILPTQKAEPIYKNFGEGLPTELGDNIYNHNFNEKLYETP